MIALLRRISRFTTILCVVAAAYAGWVIYERWQRARESERALDQMKRAEAQRIIDVYGSGTKILSFYASPPAIRRGEKTLLCYGVASARTVTLEPAVDRVWPSLGRCLEVAPRVTTTYKLTATDANGGILSQLAVVEVRLH